MNLYNRHLMDIMDIFRTYFGHKKQNLRKMGLNERQIKAVKYVKEKGKITNSEYQK